MRVARVQTLAWLIQSNPLVRGKVIHAVEGDWVSSGFLEGSECWPGQGDGKRGHCDGRYRRHSLGVSVSDNLKRQRHWTIPNIVSRTHFVEELGVRRKDPARDCLGVARGRVGECCHFLIHRD